MGLSFSPGLCAHAAWVRFPIGLVEVTAADSAAATVQRWSLSSVSLRLTAPSAEGAKGGIASADATKGLSDRPLETFGLTL